MFLVVSHQVCTHLRRDFIPLLFTDPLKDIKVLRLTFGNSNLLLPPQIFYGIKVWRLARPLQDHNVLLLEPLLCCLGRVFWVIVMLPIIDPFSTCAFLSRGTLRALRDFSPSQRSVLPIVFLVTMFPAALRSLTRSFCVNLG